MNQKIVTGKPCKRCKGTKYQHHMDQESYRGETQTWMHFYCVNCSGEGHTYGYRIRLYDRKTDPVVPGNV